MRHPTGAPRRAIGEQQLSADRHWNEEQAEISVELAYLAGQASAAPVRDTLADEREHACVGRSHHGRRCGQ
jgi:hypothetical protein